MCTHTEYPVHTMDLDKLKTNSSPMKYARKGKVSLDPIRWTDQLLKKLESLRWGPLGKKLRAIENGVFGWVPWCRGDVSPEVHFKLI